MMHVYKIAACLVFIVAGVPMSFAQVDRWSTPPRYAIALADVTVTSSPTLVCASDDNTVNCTCRNTGADAVRYGDITVSATKGARIAAGEPVEIKVRGNVYMISEGASTTLSCTKETY